MKNASRKTAMWAASLAMGATVALTGASTASASSAPSGTNSWGGHYYNPYSDVCEHVGIYGQGYGPSYPSYYTPSEVADVTGAYRVSIENIQRALHVTQDGYIGSGTNAAIRRFQASHGLTVDGIVGSATLKKLGLQWTPGIATY